MIKSFILKRTNLTLVDTHVEIMWFAMKVTKAEDLRKLENVVLDFCLVLENTLHLVCSKYVT